MNITNIIQMLKGKADIISTIESKLCQVQKYISTHTQPELAEIKSSGSTIQDELFLSNQLLKQYKLAYEEMTVNNAKASALLSKLLLIVKDYKPDIGSQVNEAEKYFNLLKQFVDEIK